MPTPPETLVLRSPWAIAVAMGALCFIFVGFVAITFPSTDRLTLSRAPDDVVMGLLGIVPGCYFFVRAMFLRVVISPDRIVEHGFVKNVAFEMADVAFIDSGDYGGGEFLVSKTPVLHLQDGTEVPLIYLAGYAVPGANINRRVERQVATMREMKSAG